MVSVINHFPACAVKFPFPLGEGGAPACAGAPGEGHRSQTLKPHPMRNLYFSYRLLRQIRRLFCCSNSKHVGGLLWHRGRWMVTISKHVVATTYVRVSRQIWQESRP